jgi:hypothetical protein
MGRQKQYPKAALIRLTNEEHRRLMAEANTVKLSLSRFMVHAGLTGINLTNEDRERHERAIVEVKRVGNNLNQISRQLNSQTGVINLGRVEQVLLETKQVLENLAGCAPEGLPRTRSGRR